MKRDTLLQRLNHFDQQDGRRIYTIKDLGKLLFAGDRALESFLYREVRRSAPILRRVAHGVYMFAYTTRPLTHVHEEIARTLRRGDHNYVSFESALSEYGRISQIPAGALTVATTGNPGRFKTSFGYIEFTRVSRKAFDLPSITHELKRPLPMATEAAAIEDLRAEGRNLHLLLEPEHDDEEFNDEARF